LRVEATNCPWVASGQVPLTPIHTLNLPGPYGDYLLTASVTLHNVADNLFQDNRRRVTCLLTDALDPRPYTAGWESMTVISATAVLDGARGINVQQTVTMHAPFFIRGASSVPIYLSCFAPDENDPNHVQVRVLKANVSALKLTTMNPQ